MFQAACFCEKFLKEEKLEAGSLSWVVFQKQGGLDRGAEVPLVESSEVQMIEGLETGSFHSSCLWISVIFQPWSFIILSSNSWSVLSLPLGNNPTRIVILGPEH